VLTSVEAFNCLLPARDVLAQSEDKFSHMLRLDAETCRLVAAVPGALRVRVNDGERRLEVVLGPGNADFSAPRCTATCQLADFQDLLAQRQNPMDLFLASKLVLDGDLEVALALGGLFL
jgi:putative sterol carrier protein